MTRRERYVLAGVFLLVVILAAAFIVVWPSMVRALHSRGWVGNKQCNAREIGLAMIMYASDHDGRYPESFGVLLKEGYLIAPRTFINDFSGSRVPTDFPEWRRLKQADLSVLNRVHQFGDYAMVKGLRHSDDPNSVLVYESRQIYKGLRGCFFNDGSLHWIPEEQFQKRMKAQEAKLRQVHEEPVRPGSAQ